MAKDIIIRALKSMRRGKDSRKDGTGVDIVKEAEEPAVENYKNVAQNVQRKEKFRLSL